MKLVAGNWKMNGSRAMAKALIDGLKTAEAGKHGAEVAICPPFTLLGTVGALLEGSGIKLGAQDCAAQTSGAFTGDVSAPMLKEAGCNYVILGHSERRHLHDEDDALVKAKMSAAHAAGLKVILCVGERDARMAENARLLYVKTQLLQSLASGSNATNTVIAYEPVWAIGSGVTPSPQQITAMHNAIMGFLPAAMGDVRILYGGSVKADNAAEILKLPGVGGVLPGGASLELESFVRIIKAAHA